MRTNLEEQDCRSPLSIPFRCVARGKMLQPSDLSVNDFYLCVLCFRDRVSLNL